MRLTAQVIKNLVHPGGKSDVVFWDEQIPNFGIRIYPSGKKAFIMMYSIRGRLRRHTLGQYPKITLHEARKMALEGLGLIAKGIDPSRPESNLSKPRTMNELLDRYLEWSRKEKKSFKLPAGISNSSETSLARSTKSGVV